VLLNRFREVYGIFGNQEGEYIARFRALAVSDSYLKADIARFAAAVCSAAELGDLAAQNIVKSEAEDLADSVARIVRRRFTPEQLEAGLTLVQCGSLLANDFYRSAFEGQVRMRLASGREEAGITWLRTKNGIESVMNLAQRLPTDTTDLMQISTGHRPAIVRF
jgi:N-acetylglucosamine kinase-like BadF-type ATPase